MILPKSSEVTLDSLALLKAAKPVGTSVNFRPREGLGHHTKPAGRGGAAQLLMAVLLRYITLHF